MKSNKAYKTANQVRPPQPLPPFTSATGCTDKMPYTELESRDVTQQGEYQTCDAVVRSGEGTYASVDEKAPPRKVKSDQGSYLVPSQGIEEAPSDKMATDQHDYLVLEPCYEKPPTDQTEFDQHGYLILDPV